MGYTNEKEVTIPYGVQSIGKKAFYSFNNLEILNWSFGFKNKIESVTLPATVKTIEEEAFNSCDNLTTVNINNGV